MGNRITGDFYLGATENDKKENLTKCPHCGANNFAITEGIVWKSSINNDGTLYGEKIITSDIDIISCRKCGEEFTQDDFNQIEFKS